MAAKNPLIVENVAAITKAAWNAIPAQRGGYLKIIARSVTSDNTVSLTVLESNDGGTTANHAARGDTLAAARAVAIAVGTVVAYGSVYSDSLIVLLRPDTTHIRLVEASPGTNDFTYLLVGI